MSEDWFTGPTSTGTLTVAWANDGWYVADSAADGDVKCILPDDVSLQNTEGLHQINARIGKFFRAVDRGPSYLFIDQIDDVGSFEGTTTNSQEATTSAKPTPNKTKERQQTDDSDSSDRTMLDKIAREKIGDEEFTVSEETDDSVIGQAKKRARKQGRDPAIDPKFQSTEDDADEKATDD